MGTRNFRNRRQGESSYDDRKSDRDESSGAKTKTARMANHRYGVEADLDELRQIQRIERTYGVRRLKRWLGEGMPYEAMGNPHTMDRFRERKGTPVPWNVEAENEASLQRSQRAIQRGPRSGETQVPDVVRDVISSPGQSLDPSIQRAMEERMGDSFGVLASEAREGSKGERSESFGDVQIHTGPQAAAACDSIDARAFTVGNHVAFDRGEYDPGSAEGQHVLAHELAHVRQQTDGRLSMLPQDDLALEIDPDPQLEREAEETAQRVMAGGELGIQRLGRSEVHVQRYPSHEKVEQARASAADRLEDDQSETTVPADPEVLAGEVEQLKAGQTQIMETLMEAKPGAPTSPGASGWLKTALKGAGGSLASAVAGAALGTAVGGPVGGIAGGLIGGVGGMASDLTKKGIEYGADRLPGSQAQQMQAMYAEISQMYKELKGGSGHGGHDPYQGGGS